MTTSTETEPDQPTRPTPLGRVRAHPVWSATIAAVLVAGIVFVLWWFQPQALLFDTVVDEDFPAVADGDPGADDLDDEPATVDDDVMGDADDGADVGGDTDSEGSEDAAPGADDLDDTDALDDDADDVEDIDDTEEATDDVEAAPSEPVALASGSFISRNRYTVEGDATVHELPDGSRVLRLEDFESTNGPDLFVYLVAAGQDDSDDAFDEDAVDLGELTGNIGNQNYDIPDEVDLDHYDTVVIWCRRFTSSFGAADLHAS